MLLRLEEACSHDFYDQRDCTVLTNSTHCLTHCGRISCRNLNRSKYTYVQQAKKSNAARKNRSSGSMTIAGQLFGHSKSDFGVNL
jgi:hypothetical protein